MQNQSLEQFYKRINKRILLVSSYLEDPDFDFIIRACRLKPLSAINNHGFVFSNVKLENIWIDEFGNSLHISNKDIKIIYNDLSLDRSKVITTDPYFGQSISKIYNQLSKLAFVLSGKDEDFKEDHYVLSLYGYDGYLRHYVYIYGQWSRNYSPLTLGIKTLKTIAAHRDVKYFLNIKNKVEQIFPCESWEAWISCLPVSKSFAADVLSQNEILNTILNKDTL